MKYPFKFFSNSAQSKEDITKLDLETQKCVLIKRQMPHNTMSLNKVLKFICFGSNLLYHQTSTGDRCVIERVHMY